MTNRERNIKANLAASYNDLVQSFTALSVETVGNYTLGKIVGKGTYGQAYQGTHKFVGGKVRIKRKHSRRLIPGRPQIDSQE